MCAQSRKKKKTAEIKQSHEMSGLFAAAGAGAWWERMVSDEVVGCLNMRPGGED